MNIYEKAHEIAEALPISDEQRIELTRTIADLVIIECMKQGERDNQLKQGEVL